MNTDKNKLLMAMGEIDDKFINEVLTEDLTGVRKKKSPVVRYMKYYLPAAAALLIVVACIKSGVFSGFGGASSSGTSADTAAPQAAYEASPAAADNYCDSAAEIDYDAKESEGMTSAETSQALWE